MKIIINRNVLAFNKTHGVDLPIISVHRSGQPVQYTKSAEIRKNGETVAKVVYQPEKPMKCGATVWIEADEIDEGDGMTWEQIVDTMLKIKNGEIK